VEKSLISAMPPPQPSWPDPNVNGEAAQIAASRQKAASAAILSKEFRIESWEEFESAFQRIEESERGTSTEVWYRGQSNSCWQLDTTLERRAGGPFAVNDYFRMMRQVKSEIEATTKHRWDFDLVELEGALIEYNPFSQRLCFGQLPYEYMAYLRHHGFPSQLLDWTGSPYIAAYFAFRTAKPSDSVAVYAFIEREGNSKTGGSDRPNIAIVGPNIETHERHYRQISRYTICAEFERSIGWQFVPHQKVFDLGAAEQDVLWKIVIPASEREKALRSLDERDLNAYKLFGSEDSLMETLAMRELDLKPKPSHD
jgi:hypothetical protein